MEVTVYSTTTCIWCRRTREFLRKHNIEFREINVAGNREATQEMIKKSGQMGVPVIEINGKVIVGFDEEALKAALGIL